MAGCSARADSQENIFKDLADNIELVSKQIRDGETKREEAGPFNPESYWNAADGILQKLSGETTKISLAFSKTPYPSNKNTELLVSELEQTMLALVSLFYSLPQGQGRVLRKTFQQSILLVLDNLKNFAEALTSCLTPNSQSRLQWTGGVWEATEFTLLRDNQSCLLKNLRGQEGLVQDALSEIAEAQESNGQLDLLMLEADDTELESWQEDDREVIEACKGMVKTSKAVVKKCQTWVVKRGDVTTRENVSSLDDLGQLTDDVSKLVDDFICLIYAPIKYNALFQSGKNLSDLNNQIIKFLRDCHLTRNEDSQWLDFLSQAINHNLDKLKASLPPQQPLDQQQEQQQQQQDEETTPVQANQEMTSRDQALDGD